MSIFVGDAGLRHGWKSLLGLASVALAILAATVAAEGALGGPAVIEQSPYRSLAFSLFLAAAALAVTKVVARRLDRAPLSRVGLGGSPREAGLELAKGASLGAALFTLALAPLLATGTARIAWHGGSPFGFLALLAALGAAALVEEVALRGYAFQHAVRGMGAWPATALFSVLFGFAHAGNPGFTLTSLVTVSLAGALLAIALLRTGRLWMSIGLHWAWNAVEGLVFGVAVSGHGGDASPSPTLFRVTLEGPTWLTGGAFGLEAGITAGVCLALGAAVLWPRAPRLPE